MITPGRMAAMTILALGSGFVGGVWFVGSGIELPFLPAPSFPAPAAPALSLESPPPATAPAPKPVESPWPANARSESFGLGPKVERTDLQPSPGCTWEIQPRPFQFRKYWLVTSPDRVLLGSSEGQGTDHSLEYLLVQSLRGGASELAVRPVFFDEQGTRYVSTSYMGKSTASSSENQLRTRYLVNRSRLDAIRQLPREEIRFFGIERVAPNAERLLAEAAQKSASDEGLPILPIPQTGKPFAFDLPTVDGRRLKLADFRGKTILIALFGGPEMRHSSLATELKLVRDAYHESVLELIPVAFHDSVEQARAELDKAETHNESLVLIKNNAHIRRLWREATLIQGLPWFFLIDRNGLLLQTGEANQIKNALDVQSKRPRNEWFRPRFVGPPSPKPPAPKGTGVAPKR